MQGQIVQRGKRRWLVRISLGRDASGRRRTCAKTVHGTKKDAEQLLTKWLREVHVGEFVAPNRTPLVEFMSEWLHNTVKHRVRPRTLADYTRLAETYLFPQLGHLPLNKVTAEAVQRVYSGMIDRGLSARTVRYAHSVLHNALERAVKLGKLGRNIAKTVEKPAATHIEMKSLTVDEALRFMREIRDDRFEVLWILLLVGGLRPCEALALKWSDFRDDRLSIQRSLSWTDDGRWHIGSTKTHRGNRPVSLPMNAVGMLERYSASREDRRAQTGYNGELDLIFENATGGPLEWRVISRRYLRPILKRAELAELRPYDLRHSSATLLFAAGENPRVVSERLGHASVAFTMDTYGHVLPDMQRGASDKLQEMLFPRTP